MFYKTKDLAIHFKINMDTAQRMCRDGRIRTTKVGRYFRIPESEWKRLLREGVPMRKVIEEAEETDELKD